MQLSAFLSLAALAQVTFANFDIYRVSAVANVNNIDYGFQIFPNDPSCDNVANTPWYGAKSNVGGNTLGVRCSGDGCDGNKNPGNVNEMEMHFTNSPLYHWTIYKNRNFDLIGLDGKAYGNCIVFPGNTYECRGSTGRTNKGARKFRCLTSVSAQQITSGR